MPNCHCCGKSTNDRESKYREPHKPRKQVDVCYDCQSHGATPSSKKFGLKQGEKKKLKCSNKCKNRKKSHSDNGNYKRKFKKLYAILKIQDGILYGFIDESICSMAWRTDAVNIWEDKPPVHYCSSGPVRNYETSVKTKKAHRVSNNADGSFIVRIHSKSCPITVNLRERWQPRPRNYRFTVKPEAFKQYPELDIKKYD